MLRRITLIVSAAGALLAAGFVFAQSSDAYSARLGWVPISLSEQRLVSGQGSATATLSRSRLRITGAFSGLPSPATSARLHVGAATGARGPEIAAFEVTGSTDGTFSGEYELDAAERRALLAGHLYIQIHAQNGVPPDDSVLRGWLLASDREESR